MNYMNWAKEYSAQAETLKTCIDREKSALKLAVNKDEEKTINRRIQILRSMYREAVLTADLIDSRGKRYGDNISENSFNREVDLIGKGISA